MGTRVIDAHVHFWNPDRLTYPWLDGVPALRRVFDLDEFEEHARSVPLEQIVFVEAACAWSKNYQEVEWIKELAKEKPGLIGGIVAHAPLEGGRAVQPVLEALAREPLVKGVRRLLQDDPDPSLCLRPAFIEGVRSLAAFHFTFDVCVREHQLPAVVELARRCSEVTFVLDHAGKPAIGHASQPVQESWARPMRELGDLPNTWCKVSGLATEAKPATQDAIHMRRYIEHVLASFGPNRVLFGSDWPVSTLATSYAGWFETVCTCLGVRDPAGAAGLFRDNAAAVYRLDAIGLVE